MLLLVLIPVILLFLYIVYSIVDYYYYSVNNEPPYINSYIPIINNAYEFSKNPYQYLINCTSKYGSIFTIKLLGQRITILTNPIDYNNYFKNKNFNFRILSDKFANQLLGLNNNTEINNMIYPICYRMITAKLNGNSLIELTANTYRNIQQLLTKNPIISNSINNNNTIELYDFIYNTLFITQFETLFGTNTNINYLEFIRQYHIFDNGLIKIMSGLIPNIFMQDIINARNYLGNILSQFTINNNTIDNNILNQSELIKQRYELFNNQYKDSEIGLLQLSVLFASMINTIPTAFRTLLYIINDSNVYNNIITEINKYLPIYSNNDNNSWSSTNLDDCILLDSCITETIRLNTSFLLLRQSINNNQFELSSQNGRKYGIREGDHIALFTQFAHLDNNKFTNSEEFQYDRFIINNNSNNNKSSTGIGFIGFGSGAHLCPGRYWAKNEIKILLGFILRYIDIEFINPKLPLIMPAGGIKLNRVGVGVLPPDQPIMVKLKYKQNIV